MGDVLYMDKHQIKKLDCQGENVPDDKMERAVSAAAALARCVRWMQEDFGDKFAMDCLANEILRVKRRK